MKKKDTKLVLEFVVMVVQNLMNTPEMTDLYTWKLRIFIIEIECEPSLLRIVIKKKKKAVLEGVVLKLERAAVRREQVQTQASWAPPLQRLPPRV